MCFPEGKGPIKKKRHVHVGNSCVFDFQTCSKTSVVENPHNKNALTVLNVLGQKIEIANDTRGEHTVLRTYRQARRAD